MATIQNLNQPIDCKISLESLLLIKELVIIAQKSTGFNPSPVQMKEQLAELPQHKLAKIGQDIEQIILDNQILNP